jgi:hypothetical protein
MRVTWSAKNNSSFLKGHRNATSVMAAVRAGREYVREELYGEGTLSIFIDDECVRQDERSIFTGFKWLVTENV